MAIPISYNLRNLSVRSASTAMMIGGVAMVVATFVMVLALADGFRRAYARTGSDRNAIVLRFGSTSELNSGLSRDQVRLVAARATGLAELAGDGSPLVSPEMLVVINHPRRDDPDQSSNLAVRGVSPLANQVRANLEIVEGRWLAPGKGELVIGKAAAARFANTRLGDTIEFAKRTWTVAGIFAAGGGAFESEIFGDAEEMLNAFGRTGFQTVTVRLQHRDDFESFKSEIAKETNLQVDVYREQEYYVQQSRALRNFILVVGVVVCSIMSVGAIAGALNTMNGAVLSRRREIGTLRALGFSRVAVLVSFLFEVLVLAAVGGVIGCTLALSVDGLQTGTMNWESFSDVSFSFHVDWVRHFGAGIAFALVMGALGGFFPALRAASANISRSLRQY
ncbi:MAG: ABC transporter permease [Candidatus Schekmanbacteria bacterium]|nr:ABC transporter permease [Candidatus Schekmanbacteria bacterium]